MPSPRSSCKVFIVDDDEAVRDSLKLLLEIRGFDVEDYGTTEALAAHYRKPPRGCVILDQHLPVTSGLDFLSSPAGRRLGVPVILITGQGDPLLRRRAEKAGVAAYLDKPVPEHLLLATVDRVIGASPDEGAGPRR